MQQDNIKFNPFQMFDGWEEKLAQNPRTRKFLQDEVFKEYFMEFVENPLLLRGGVKDPKLSECLMVLMGVDMSKYYQAKKPGSNAEEEIEQELQENGVDVEEAKEKAPEEVVNLMDEVMKRKKTYKAPEDDEERKELANKEKELGNECYKKKLFEEALEHYNKAIQLDKKNIIFQLNKSAVFFELGQWDFCAQICRNLINRIDDKERHARIALRLANALYNSNELEEAEKYFAVAITDGVKGIEKKYEELKRKNSERRDLEIRKGPTMNKEIERLLMNEEAREIIKLLNESPKNIKIIKNDPKKKELLEKMLRLGIVQSQS